MAGIIALAVLIPFVLPFVHAKDQFGFQRGLDEVSYWSAGLKSLLRTTTHSWLYTPFQVGIFGLQTSSERELYPGIVTLLLAGLGLFAPVRDVGARFIAPSRRPWLFGVVALTGLILSFGPWLNLDSYAQGQTGVPLPYKWLYEHVPGFDAIRVPHRFAMLFLLGLAVCAGYGVARLQLWARHRLPGVAWSGSGVAAAVLALVLAEFFASGTGATSTPTGTVAPPVYRWLAGEEAASIIGKDDLILELPVGSGDTPINTNPIYLLYGLAHNRPMLNGSSNIVPSGYDRLFYEMRRFPTSGTLDIIEGLGVKFLVVHTYGLLNQAKRDALTKESAPAGRLEPVKNFPDYTGEPGFSDVIYRVKPDPLRFAGLAAAIPEGSSVLLADQPAINRRLYTSIIPRLIGSNRLYFCPYTTIYDGVIGDIRPALPSQKYDYAILYGNTDPAQYGYAAPDAVYTVDMGDNSFVRVYHKR